MIMTRLITRAEAAQLLRVSLPTMDKLAKRGALKRIELGSRVLFLEEDIMAAILAARH